MFESLENSGFQSVNITGRSLNAPITNVVVEEVYARMVGFALAAVRPRVVAVVVCVRMANCGPNVQMLRVVVEAAFATTVSFGPCAGTKLAEVVVHFVLMASIVRCAQILIARVVEAFANIRSHDGAARTQIVTVVPCTANMGFPARTAQILNVVEAAACVFTARRGLVVLTMHVVGVVRFANIRKDAVDVRIRIVKEPAVDSVENAEHATNPRMGTALHVIQITCLPRCPRPKSAAALCVTYNVISA